MLAAIRCGEMQPVMLARTVATLDHVKAANFALVISSDFPGEVGQQRVSF
jgi:alkanesulfonate monooxygenase